MPRTFEEYFPEYDRHDLFVGFEQLVIAVCCSGLPAPEAVEVLESWCDDLPPYTRDGRFVVELRSVSAVMGHDAHSTAELRKALLAEWSAIEERFKAVPFETALADLYGLALVQDLPTEPSRMWDDWVAEIVATEQGWGPYLDRVGLFRGGLYRLENFDEWLHAAWAGARQDRAPANARAVAWHGAGQTCELAPESFDGHGGGESTSELDAAVEAQVEAGVAEFVAAVGSQLGTLFTDEYLLPIIEDNPALADAVRSLLRQEPDWLGSAFEEVLRKQLELESAGFTVTGNLR
ncbi:hypothetical protein ACIQMR_31785 [Streptomyces sp. NPDC091376]|uniref:hypothetical protein n=1 Tax=Streptomyces sp. NPDC091376 TaxID=3365994 RepID=UPI003827504E